MRALRWLLVALVLFGLAAYLMRGEEDERKTSLKGTRADALPRRWNPEDVERRKRRATVTELVPAESPDEQPRQIKRDPFLLAMPPVSERENAVVIEASAIRFSAIGERIVNCLQRNGEDVFGELREKSGFDPLQDLDRVGVTDKLVMVSGRFPPEGIARLAEDDLARDYGDHARIYEDKNGEAAALWKDEVFLIAESPAEIEAAIDRLEGRGEPVTPTIAEQDAYGEIYGHLSPKTLLEILPEESRERLGAKLDRAAERIDLHVSVDEDVGLVTTVRGQTGDELSDLAKSLGAALAIGRVVAKREGEEDLAELLDLARVARPYDHSEKTSFDTELVLPRAVLEKHLARVCAPPGEAVGQ